MASIQTHVASRTRQAVEDLIRVVRRVPEDKLKWHAVGDARTVLDLVQECAEVNARWTEVLGDGEWMVWAPETIKRYMNEIPTLELAIDRFRQATESFVKVVLAISNERLDEEIELPWGKFTVGDCMMHALWHISYHEGQINYIQTLYGDWSE